MVKFYAPYCGHCNKMIPAYNKLAENLKDLVEVVAVDCTDSSNQNLCGKYRVEGYPTLKFFIVQESESSEKKTTTMKKKKIVLGNKLLYYNSMIIHIFRL
jgi:thiol-disulfide isomerase/thioredoxin